MSATVTPICRAANAAPHTGTHTSPRIDALLTSYRAVGYVDGERAGYTTGWRYGLVCGALFGALALAGMLVLGVWAHGGWAAVLALPGLRGPL